MISNGLLPLPMCHPPRNRWAPLVSIHILPRHRLPHEKEFLRAGPVVLLTQSSDVQPVRSAMGRDLNALDIQHYVLLWDSCVVNTFPPHSHFH